MPTQQQRQPQRQGRQGSGRSSVPKGRTALIGNLTKEPELHYPDKGQSFARCGLAVERPTEDGNWSGERVTTFYELAVFGEMGENFANSCNKGTRVLVIGRAELETWTDNEGRQQQTRKVLVDAVGPDLRWAVAEVAKTHQAGGQRQDRDEGHFDEEPF